MSQGIHGRGDWNEFQRITDELTQRGIDVTYGSLGHSVHVWLRCCTCESVRQLQDMLYNNLLHDIILNLFNFLLQQEIFVNLEVKLSLTESQFKLAMDYFLTSGN